MASSENGTDEPLCKGEIETQKWRTDVWSQEGNGGHVMGWIGRQGLTLLRIKQTTKENFLYSTGKSTQFLCGDLNAKKKQKRRDLCIHIADSLSVQQKLTQSSYTPIKILKRQQNKVGYQSIRVSREPTCLCTPAGPSHCLWEAQLRATADAMMNFRAQHLGPLVSYAPCSQRSAEDIYSYIHSQKYLPCRWL